MQDMHILAERHLLTVLRDKGFVKGDVEEMLDRRIGALFMPHGQFPSCDILGRPRP